MRKWERNKVNKFAKGFLIGIGAGLILGLLLKNLGLFLPLGGIIGMCAGITRK